jgi:thioredoxin
MRILSTIILLSIFLAANSQSKNNTAPKSNADKKYIFTLNDAEFKKKIFNYSVNKTWKYEGTTPSVIDFYADWCGPCKRVSPLLEELAKQYNGKIVFYKVNTDNETILSGSLGISSLPTILFIPAKGNPQAMIGAYPKDQIEKVIKEFLIGESKK